jgi:hypothetical protein
MTTLAYADINTLVQVAPGTDILTGDLAVQNMVVNVLICQKRSRGFRKLYGSETQLFLQRPATPENAALLRNALFKDLQTWCSTIATFSLANIVINVVNSTQYLVYIGYQSIQTGFFRDMQFPLNSTQLSG